MQSKISKPLLLNLYSFHWPRSRSGFRWTPPFLAYDDGIALNAMLEMANSCPDLQRKYLYRLGTFCPETGRIVPLKDPIVVRMPKTTKKDEKR